MDVKSGPTAAMCENCTEVHQMIMNGASKKGIINNWKMLSLLIDRVLFVVYVVVDVILFVIFIIRPW